MGLMLLLIFLSITVTEGNRDWMEPPHKMYESNCNAQPTVYSYPMPEEYLLPFNEIEGNLTGTQGVWSISECYVSKIRDCEEYHQLPPTSPVGFLYKRTRIIEDVPQHPVDVRGQRGSYFHCGQHSIIWWDGNSQRVDLTHAVELG